VAGFEILGFENLTAVQAFDIVYAVASGEELGSLMRTRGMHRARLVLFIIMPVALSRGGICRISA